MLVSQTIHLAIKVDDPQFQQQKAVFESANRGKPTKMLSNGDSSQKITDLPKCLYARLGTQVARACNMLKDATSELLALSILIPSAPWVSDLCDTVSWFHGHFLKFKTTF